MVQYFLRNDRIQKLFVENVTTLIKMWRFLERVSSPSAVKKGEAEAGTLYAWRCDVLQTFYRRFAALTEKKATQEPLPYTEENVSAQYVLPSLTNWPTVATCKT